MNSIAFVQSAFEEGGSFIPPSAGVPSLQTLADWLISFCRPRLPTPRGWEELRGQAR